MEFDVDQQILRNARRKIRHSGDDEISAFEIWALRRCPSDFIIASKDSMTRKFARKARESMHVMLILYNP
jgi:hypothetical protein